MNYNWTGVMDVINSSNAVIGTTTYNIVWKNAMYSESAQGFVRGRIINNIYGGIVSTNTGVFRDKDSKYVETYSEKGDNNGTYVRITATATRYTTNVAPMTTTFTIDNQSYNDWSDALWDRLASILGMDASTVVNRNNYIFTNLIFTFHD